MFGKYQHHTWETNGISNNDAIFAPTEKSQKDQESPELFRYEEKRQAHNLVGGNKNRSIPKGGRECSAPERMDGRMRGSFIHSFRISSEEECVSHIF